MLPSPRLLALLLAAPWLSPAAPPPLATLFASHDQVGQVRALSCDDAGRLFAACTRRAPDSAHGAIQASDEVLWLVASPGGGPAQRGEVVAQGLSRPGDGPGSALLALPGGRWLYGSLPTLWHLDAPKGTLRANAPRPAAEGFGVTKDPAGADLHALLEAPNGWIYFGMGERGFALRTPGGGRLRSLASGAIFRCRPDGSHLTQIARGLRNPTGLAMLPDGRLLALDQAAPGGHSRLLQVIPGADFGWRGPAQSAPSPGFIESREPSPTPDPQYPQWTLPALASLPGEASALELLPDGTLLAADQAPGGRGGIQALRLDPDSLAVRETTDLWRGGAVLAMTQDPLGSLYFADWGPQVDATGSCAVRRLTWPTAPDSPIPLLTQVLPSLAPRDLPKLLEHPSPRVRLRARQRLEALPFQDSLEPLLETARDSPSLSARLHGLWGAAAVARQDPALLPELHPFLSDPQPALRAAACAALGDAQPPRLPPGVIRCLTDPSPLVRLAAAAAIAQAKPPAMAPALLAAAATNAARDPLLRTSLAHAMAEATPSAILAEMARDYPSPEARLTAVLALRSAQAPELADFLPDSDPTVATEAARAIYDLPVLQAYPALAAALQGGQVPRPQAFAARALAAAWYLGSAADAARVSAFAQAPASPEPLRRLALQLLATWDLAEGPEPIWQRPTRPWPRLPGLADSALRETAPPPDPSRPLLAASSARSPAQWKTLLLQPDAALPERLAAWQSLSSRNAIAPSEALALTLPAQPPDLRAQARAWLIRQDPAAAAPRTAEALASGSIPEKQAALHALDWLPGNGNANEAFLLSQARKLSTGQVEPAIQVEVLEALQRRDIESRSPWRRATDDWAASLALNSDPLAAWRPSQDHGDPSAGRRLFETHPQAACLSCHSRGGLGGLLGPDLDGVGQRLSPAELLESLVHPSATFAPGYAPPPNPLTDSPDSPPLSRMPPYGSLLTLRELRDLIAYLHTLQEP